MIEIKALSLSQQMNEAIKDTINKMAKTNKCFSLILNNAHAVMFMQR